jgi:hypothetical protein
MQVRQGVGKCQMILEMMSTCNSNAASTVETKEGCIPNVAIGNGCWLQKLATLKTAHKYNIICNEDH